MSQPLIPATARYIENHQRRLKHLIGVEMESKEALMQFFAYAHLPEHLQAVSRPFGELAQLIVDTLPRNAERTVALRKLLESKDCAVRALLFKDPNAG